MFCDLQIYLVKYDFVKNLMVLYFKLLMLYVVMVDYGMNDEEF